MSTSIASAPLIDRSTDDDITQRTTSSGDTQTYRNISKHLKIHTFALSAITFGLLVADFILIKTAPQGTFDWSHYHARRETKELGSWILGSLVVSIFNVKILPLHALINLVLNITFATGIIKELVGFFSALPDGMWCERWEYPPQLPRQPLPAEPECIERKKLVKIMMIVSGVFASLLALQYILRALLRCIVILKSKFWTKSSWSIPTGNYTFQISLNVIRRDAAEAGSTSGHGPVHL